MLQILSRNIIDVFILNNVISKKEDRDIYAYGMELILSSIINILSVLIISIFFGKFAESVAFFLAFIPIRTYAGGYHAKTHLGCFSLLMVVYCVVLILIFFIPDNLLYASTVGLSLVSVVLTSIFAPVEDANKVLTKEEKIKYRKISITIVLTQLVFLIHVLFMFNLKSISLGFSLGQISAALSLMAVKLIKYRR